MKLNTHNYKELITALSLTEFWEDKLRIRNTKANSTALRMLDGINENVRGTAISKQVHNTQNNTIRKYAKSIYTKYADDDAFRFLEDDFDRDFNSLDAVRIHSALKQKNEEKPLPLLMKWVNRSQDNKYIAFLIKEIGYFKQKESANRLFELYKKTEYPVIKAQIVETLGELEYTRVISTFIEDFDFSIQDVQNSIIDTMGKFGGTKALQFLEDIYYQTHSKETLIKILYNIRQIDKNGNTFAKLKHDAFTDFEKSAISFVELGNDNMKIS